MKYAHVLNERQEELLFFVFFFPFMSPNSPKPSSASSFSWGTYQDWFCHMVRCPQVMGWGGGIQWVHCWPPSCELVTRDHHSRTMGHLVSTPSLLVLMLRILPHLLTSGLSCLYSFPLTSLILMELCGVKNYVLGTQTFCFNISAINHSETLLIVQCGLGQGKMAFWLGEKEREREDEWKGGQGGKDKKYIEDTLIYISKCNPPTCLCTVVYITHISWFAFPIQSPKLFIFAHYHLFTCWNQVMGWFLPRKVVRVRDSMYFLGVTLCYPPWQSRSTWNFWVVQQSQVNLPCLAGTSGHSGLKVEERNGAAHRERKVSENEQGRRYQF